MGGGSIGLNCAYSLLKSGRSVTLLDAKEIAQGSSSGNAGHIVPSHVIPLAAPGVVSAAIKWALFDSRHSPFGMKFSLDPSYLLWLVRFAAACSEANVKRGIAPLNQLGSLSAANFARMIAEEKFDCAYQQAGLLHLFKTEKAFHETQREAAFMKQHGVPVEIYDAQKIHEVEPAAAGDVLGGIHFSGDAHLNPAEFLRLLKDKVKEMGAALLEETRVTGFETSREKITTVHTTGEDFQASEIVLAAGAYTPAVARRLRLNVPIQPARGYSLTLSASQLTPSHALILGERRVAVTPLGDSLRITGRLEVGAFGLTPSPKWLARIGSAAREYLRLDENLEVQQTWAGLRPTTPDGLPIIGRAPRYQNLILAAGHAMLGLSLGPGTGQLVAEIANGQTPAVTLAPFQLERF